MNFLFPIIAVFSFYNISTKIIEKFDVKYDTFLFSIIAFLIYLILITNFIIFKINIIWIYYLSYIIFIFTSLNFILFQRTKLINLILNNKISFIVFAFFLTLSLLPLSSADSYAYHLAWPKDLILNPEIIFNPLEMEYRVVGNGEIINYIGLLFGSENLQSFLCCVVIYFYVIKKKNKHLLFLIILSTPVFLKYSLDQKPFLLPCLIFAIFLGNLINKIHLKDINNLDLIGFFLSFYFFAGSKYPFLVLAAIVAIYILILSIRYNFFKRYVIYGFIFFLLCFFPLPFAKYLAFGDPFSPFLEGILNEGNQDIADLRLMYAFWDGYKLDEEEFIPLLRNLFNFIVPIKPFSLLDTYGFSVLLIFFYRFKHKDEIILILLMALVTSLMVIYTNFQSRWYLFIATYVVFLSDNFLIPKKYFKIIKFSLIGFSALIFCSYFYFLGFVFYNSSVKSFEDTKEKTMYLYADIKKVKNIANDELILTNTRANYFSDKLIKFKYPKTFSDQIYENEKLNLIKFGFFSVGVNYDNLADLRKYSVLRYFKKDCYTIIDYSDNLVAKRNLFSNKNYEKFVILKFKKQIKHCLIF